MTTHRSALIASACVAIAVAALAAAPARAELLAAWDNWTDTDSSYAADHLATGFAASIDQNSATDRINGSFGSNDGTFGSAAGASLGSSNNGGPGLLVRSLNNQNHLTITLTNNTASAYNVDSFHYDFAPRSATGPNHVVLTYVSGGLGSTSVDIDKYTAPYFITSDSLNRADYPDYDYNLTDYLSDTTLAPGESATFTMDFTYDGTSSPDGFTSSIVDNVAFIGTAIPEPASIALFAAAGLLLGVPRRRHV